MVRYSKSHKNLTRQTIIEQAAARFRRDGIAAVGVRALMEDAGLTHGSFYAHFESRAELVKLAIEFAADNTLHYLRQVAESAEPREACSALVRAYLSMGHVEHRALGCAVSALAPEIAREGPDARAQFLKRNQAIIDLIATTFASGGTLLERSARAQTVFATLLGTLQLARISPAAHESAQLLVAGREAALLLANAPWN